MFEEAKFSIENPEEMSVTLRTGSNEEVTSINELLGFSEAELDTDLENHAAKQFYWESITLDAEQRLEEFENEGWAKWWAHHRIYAKWYLVSVTSGVPKLDDVRDCVILLFSEEATDEERTRWANGAFTSFLLEKHGRKAVESFGSTDKYDVQFKEFKAKMFAYQCAETPWYYETVVRTKAKYKREAGMLAKLARSMDNRGFKLHSYTNLVQAKMTNIGPMSIKDADERSLHFERRS